MHPFIRLVFALFLSCLSFQTVCADQVVNTTVPAEVPVPFQFVPLPDNSAYEQQHALFQAEGQMLDYGVNVTNYCKTTVAQYQTQFNQAVATKSYSAAVDALRASQQLYAQSQKISNQVFQHCSHNDSPAGRAFSQSDANLAAANQAIIQMNSQMPAIAAAQYAAAMQGKAAAEKATIVQEGQDAKLAAQAAALRDARHQTEQNLTQTVDGETDCVVEFAQFTTVVQTAANATAVTGQFVPGATQNAATVEVPFESLPANLAAQPYDQFLDGLRSIAPTTGLAQAFKYQADLLRMTEVDVPAANRSIWETSVTALKVAYQDVRDKVGDASLRFYQMSKTLLTYAATPKGFADIGSAVTPGVSEARGLYELISGKDAVNGTNLGMGARALVGVGVMLGVGSGPEEVAITIERVLAQDALTASKASIEAAESIAETERVQAGTVAALEEAEKESPKIIDSIVTNDPNDLADLGKVLTDADQPNKVAHIFANPRHNMDWMVQQYGSAKDAYTALVAATGQAITSQKITGIFETTVQIGEKAVTVEGKVVNGVVRISTAYIPTLK